MAVNINKIGDFLIEKKDESVVRTFLDYFNLMKKFKSPKSQSWYFERGMISNLDRVSLLEKRFEKIRMEFNNSTVDSLIERLNANNEFITRFKKRGMSSIQRIYYNSVLGQNKYIIELIRLKGKIETLEPIDYYVENSDEILLLYN